MMIILKYSALLMINNMCVYMCVRLGFFIFVLNCFSYGSFFFFFLVSNLSITFVEHSMLF